ncbi:MAG: deoxynucleoside kinase [Candidatus Eisenbacteria bacterium]|nr:deoxynucleoside kinase [Candidatus Eisenbacteria bacterium]
MPRKNYVAIEGVIGVGKTTLASLLAKKWGAHLKLEVVEENPFLAQFYQDMRGYAFQTQLFFLLSRHRQQSELKQIDIFMERVVSDYLFAKDRIFANITLDDNELALYKRLADMLERDVPKPDIVVYLQASVESLMERIRRRGREFERDMSTEYIETLNEAYNYFFFHYKDTPLIVVNTDDINFVENTADFEELAREIEEHDKGTAYYVPIGTRT